MTSKIFVSVRKNRKAASTTVRFKNFFMEHPESYSPVCLMSRQIRINHYEELN